MSMDFSYLYQPINPSTASALGLGGNFNSPPPQPPQTFGAQTDYYSALGASYGRQTGYYGDTGPNPYGPSGTGAPAYDPASYPDSVWDTGSGRTYTPTPAAPGTYWGSNPAGGYWFPIPIPGYETNTSLIPQQPSDATSMSTPNPVYNQDYSQYPNRIDVGGGRSPETTPWVPGQTGWASDPNGQFWYAQMGFNDPSYFPSGSGVSNPAVDAINNAIGPQVSQPPTDNSAGYPGGIGGFPNRIDVGGGRSPENTPWVPGQTGWLSDPGGQFWYAEMAGMPPSVDQSQIQQQIPGAISDLQSTLSQMDTAMGYPNRIDVGGGRSPETTPWVPGQTGWLADPGGQFWYAQMGQGGAAAPSPSGDTLTPADIAIPQAYPNRIDIGGGRSPETTPWIPGQTGWNSDPGGQFWYAQMGNQMQPTTPSEQVSMGYGSAANAGGYDPYFGSVGGYPNQVFAGWGASPETTPWVPGQTGWLADPTGSFWYAQMGNNPLDAMAQMPGPDYTTLPPAQPAVDLPAWTRTIPTAQRNDDVTNAITSGVGDPAATAQLIYRESNWGQNPGTVGGNYGAGRMAPDDFKLSGGTLNGMTYDQYVNAPLAAQIGAYNDFFNRFQTRNPGLDISQYDAATQYAIRQAANFTPWNPSAWLPSFLAGNSDVQITPKDQGGDIGIPTINSLIAIARSRGL